MKNEVDRGFCKECILTTPTVQIHASMPEVNHRINGWNETTLYFFLFKMTRMYVVVYRLIIQCFGRRAVM